MQRHKIENSSNIAEIGYDPEKMTLEIKFHNGHIYQYWPITRYAYDNLIRSGSKGKFFYKNIRGNSSVNYRKLDDLQAEE